MTASAAQYRALIVITTCRRLERIRRYLPHYANFCASDSRFSLLVSLDGTEEPYIDFCAEWDLPLIHSDEREGVGLSKNRVLRLFPDFDYYFFLDDDVELTDGGVFSTHVSLAVESGIHHFSLFARDGLRSPKGESLIGGWRVAHGMFGGGQFSFFTNEGIRRVGGWHTDFAEFRRWGHTEHSYRFFRTGLAPAPFNVVTALSETCIWHYPPTVTKTSAMHIDGDQISEVERRLMDTELEYFPVTTLSEAHFNGGSFENVQKLGDLVRSGQRYPLVEGSERRQCAADYSLWRARVARSPLVRWAHVLRAAALWPANPRLRHQLKTGR